jgi:ribonuclease D
MNICLATLENIDVAIAQFSQADRLCVDTEFHAERRYYPKLYLVQVHVAGGDTWLLDPLVDGLMDRVAPILRAKPWLVHAGKHDIRILSKVLGAVPKDILDVQIGAGLAGSRFPQSYGKLVLEYLGREIDKSHTLSDWSRRPLSTRQIDYAAGDVQQLPGLWAAISTVLQGLDRMEICRSACAEAQRDYLDPGWDARQWRALHAVSVMKGDSLNTLRALASWREETARSLDQPSRSVLSDGLMIELSKRQPQDVESLRGNRRFPKGTVKRHGEVLTGIISKTSQQPSSTWPVVIRHLSSQARQLAWLRAFALVAGAQGQFAASLVLPDAVLKPLILERPQTRHDLSLQLGHWRDHLLGDALWDALRGEVTLRLLGDDVEPSAG